jgi:predicted TIM-barrel fold metal-dependent hydrolase
MILDCHVHIAAGGSGYAGNHLAPSLFHSLRFRQLKGRLGLAQEVPAGDLDERLRDGLCRWLSASALDQAVVLALDAVHHGDGTRDLGQTKMAVDNDYVADLADAEPKVLFGASVHPYRRDALEELDRVAARGACLVKWLPSAQGILPDDPRCFPFYERMAQWGLPLLSHTGCEHTLGVFPDAWNDPRRLIPALERGVTVIAAHCGTRLFLHERSWFGVWRTMALRYPGFYGDLSAFLACTRMLALRAILRTPELAAKVVYGSDFPAPVWPINLLGLIAPQAYLRLKKIENPLDRSWLSLAAAGLGPEVFARAGGLLRVSHAIHDADGHQGAMAHHRVGAVPAEDQSA